MARAFSKSGSSRVFLVAALFNYVIGFPILWLRRWPFDISFVEAVGRDPMALRLWADFGFAVVLIGYGYQIIARDVDRNRGIVILGIGAKLFDVINLSTLYAWGLSHSVVLIPAAIDGLFTLAFIAFLRSWPALPVKK